MPPHASHPAARTRAALSKAFALSLLLPGLAFAERPKLVTHDDTKGRARVEGCRSACSEWVQFPRSRPRAIVEATLSASGQHFLVWSRAEGQARELDFFEVPGMSGGTARRLGHVVPGFGGELGWLPGERVLHVWGCGTGCQRVRVYALDGATLFDGEASLHETSSRGSVTTATHGGIVRVFDATSGRSFASAADARLGVPLASRFGAHEVTVHYLAERDDTQRYAVTCRFDREMTCTVAAVGEAPPQRQ